jgi:hypothetical protein
VIGKFDGLRRRERAARKDLVGQGDEGRRAAAVGRALRAGIRPAQHAMARST